MGCARPLTARSSTPTATASSSLTQTPFQTPPAVPPTSAPPPTSPSGQLVPAVQAVEQAAVSTQLVSRTYQWSYGGKQWTWEVAVPQVLYDYYRALPRTPTRNYSVYVTHPLDDEYIGLLTGKIRQCVQQEGYGDYQAVSLTAAFVQSLAHTSDSVTTGYDEYPRYPVETLVDNGGDCEDTAILAASLIEGLGYGAVLIIFPPTAESPGHCALGVKGSEGIYGSYWEFDGERYYYLETTDTGWEIGQVPDEYDGALARVYPMVPVPVLTHSWTVKSSGATIELKVTVNNLGSAAAYGIYVYAGFDAGDNQCWNPQKSPTFQLGVNQSVVAISYLVPPIAKHTRLLVQIVYEGYAVDESYSKWFDT